MDMWLTALSEMGTEGRLLVLKLMSRFMPSGFRFETLEGGKFK